jgi:hypothetical protein
MASPISIAGFDRLRDPVATVPFPSVLLVLHSAVRSRPDYTCAVAIMRVVREYDTHTPNSLTHMVWPTPTNRPCILIGSIDFGSRTQQPFNRLHVIATDRLVQWRLTQPAFGIQRCSFGLHNLPNSLQLFDLGNRVELEAHQEMKCRCTVAGTDCHIYTHN